jgi:hypothetical protein
MREYAGGCGGEMGECVPEAFFCQQFSRIVDNPRKARQMNPIIEKVADAILDSGEGCLSGAVYVDPHKSARAAIRATLEHLKENVSEDMDLEGGKVGDRFTPDGLFGHGDPDFNTATKIFKAMLTQAIAKIDAS